MKEEYVVLRHQRGQGWVAACSPSGRKSAVMLRDQIRRHFGKGAAMLCRIEH